MPRDLDVYDYNAHFERIERSFQNYADGLRRDANVPQWAAFNVTLEEFFANESVVMTVLERWYARYAASNAELAGVIVNGAGTQIYVKRLFVQSLLYMFCARWGRADSAERYRMGAFQDLIRSLGIFRDRNVRVDVGMLPSGTYRMAGGGILTVSIIGSSLNGTQNVQRQ
jgi:hypothetical protein